MAIPGVYPFLSPALPQAPPQIVLLPREGGRWRSRSPSYSSYSDYSEYSDYSDYSDEEPGPSSHQRGRGGYPEHAPPVGYPEPHGYATLGHLPPGYPPHHPPHHPPPGYLPHHPPPGYPPHHPPPVYHHPTPGYSPHHPPPGYPPHHPPPGYPPHHPPPVYPPHHPPPVYPPHHLPPGYSPPPGFGPPAHLPPHYPPHGHGYPPPAHVRPPHGYPAHSPHPSHYHVLPSQDLSQSSGKGLSPFDEAGKPSSERRSRSRRSRRSRSRHGRQNADKQTDDKKVRKRLPDGPLEPEREKEKEKHKRKRLPDGPLEPEAPRSRKRLPVGPFDDETAPTRRRHRRSGPDGKSNKENASPKKRRTGPKTIKISGIPKVLSYRYVQELFEGAVGKIKTGELEESGVAFITFEKAHHVAKCIELFDGGCMDGSTLKVEMQTD
eukprot:TRINITY_DN5401_c0_g1_i1.p1 TRINITY_DN5401_c0_g1~~TRINITY_DN5401_c0_g1_i1.p1  ORF type:complete len:434 (-),score=70.75 TRINITY_DN5401_c0_g1_i1:103-1404(-)